MQYVKRVFQAKQHFVLLIMLFSVLLLPLVTGCSGPIKTLGTVLTEQQQLLQGLIERAANRADGLIVEAGNQTDILIEDARWAYNDMLNTSIDKVDRVTNSRIEEIKTMVNDLNRGLNVNVANIRADVQQFVDTVPLADTKPYVKFMTPKFYAWSSTPQPIRLEIFGRFRFAAQENFQPSLQVEDKQYVLDKQFQGNTDQSLVFYITPIASGLKDQITVSKLMLSVPYEEGTVLKKHKVATYNLLIGRLPENPGKIILQSTYERKKVATVSVTSPSWTQSSVSEDPKQDVLYEDWASKPHGEKDPITPIPPGDNPQDWRVVQASVRFVVDKAEVWGWSAKTVAKDPSKKSLTNANLPESDPDYGTLISKQEKLMKRLEPTVAFNVTTNRKYFDIVHPMFPKKVLDTLVWGVNLTFHFEYDIEHPVSEKVTQEVPVTITWGERQAFDVKDASAWKVIFTSFDGKRQEIAGAELLRYLWVKKDGTTVTIQVPGASDVTY